MLFSVMLLYAMPCDAIPCHRTPAFYFSTVCSPVLCCDDAMLCYEDDGGVDGGVDADVDVDAVLSRRAIIRHDIGWFDKDENSVGSLTTQLEEDTSKARTVLLFLL